MVYNCRWMDSLTNCLKLSNTTYKNYPAAKSECFLTIRKSKHFECLQLMCLTYVPLVLKLNSISWLFNHTWLRKIFRIRICWFNPTLNRTHACIRDTFFISSVEFCPVLGLHNFSQGLVFNLFKWLRKIFTPGFTI